MSTLPTLVDDFLKHVIVSGVEIYNEFSLQHELGIFIRSKLPGYLVQFERNISYFGYTKSTFTKRELDIAVFSPDRSELKMAIELKFPRSGQVPEQMFSFCKDIAFSEELKKAGFLEAGLLIFVDDHLFYQGSNEGIYGHFRGSKPISGNIKKPTGASGESVSLEGTYSVSWSRLNADVKYMLIAV